MPVLTFLSDYGLADAFVGICHGVIAARCPEARVIDITHGIPRQDVHAGAVVLADALPYMPAGVHLAVVDPGVGGARRALAIHAEGGFLVGPDNGLLLPGAEVLGGVAEAVEISGSPARLEPISATFHGRDVFAPVAAALAAGAELRSLGTSVDPASLVRLEQTAPALEDGALVAHVVLADAYGNLALDARARDLDAVGVTEGGEILILAGDRTVRARRGRSFGEVATGEVVVLEDSSRRLAVVVNGGSAAERLAAHHGDPLTLRPA